MTKEQEQEELMIADFFAREKERIANLPKEEARKASIQVLINAGILKDATHFTDRYAKVMENA